MHRNVIKIFAFLDILFITCILIVPSYNLTNFLRNNLSYTLLSESFTEREIIIEGNHALDSYCDNLETNGLSWDTAYEIFGYDIDYMGSTNAITIKNTDRYLVIKNFIINNSGNEYSSGICLESCRNIMICDSIISNFLYGIRFLNSDNNFIINNSIISNGYGIWFNLSNNNSVYSNNINYNYINGINFEKSHNNILSRTNVICNSLNGIYLLKCDFNLITSNNIQNHSNSGIYSHFSNNTQIIENILLKIERNGLYIKNCEKNLLKSNTITDCYTGILIHSSNNTKISSNTFINNEIEVRQVNSQGNIIADNMSLPQDYIFFMSLLIETCVFIFASITSIVLIFFNKRKKSVNR